MSYNAVWLQTVVQKLFESAKQKDELTTWCETVLKGVETAVDCQFHSCFLSRILYIFHKLVW